ncbi:MAG: hypothetical protein AB7U83_12850 [Vicinamibacterales bacterium]
MFVLAICGNVALLSMSVYLQLAALFMSGYFDAQRQLQVRAFVLPDGQALGGEVDRRLALYGVTRQVQWQTVAFAGYSISAACVPDWESRLCLEFRLRHGDLVVTADNRLTAAVFPDLVVTDRPITVRASSDPYAWRWLRRRRADIALPTSSGAAP